MSQLGGSISVLNRICVLSHACKHLPYVFYFVYTVCRCVFGRYMLGRCEMSHLTGICAPFSVLNSKISPEHPFSSKGVEADRKNG